MQPLTPIKGLDAALFLLSPASRFVASSQQGSQSAALSRLATIEGRIRARQQAQQSATTQGHAVEGTPRHTVPPTAPNPGPSPPPPRGHSPPELPLAPPLSPQLSDNDPGSPRKRFLKKTSVLAAAGGGDLSRSEGAKVSVDVPAATDAGVSVSKYRSGGAVKPGGVKAEPAAGEGRGVSLDSDEESMRKLLGDSLDSTEDSLLRHRRLPMKKTVAKVARWRLLHSSGQTFVTTILGTQS